VLNKKEIQAKDFDVQMNGVTLKDAAKKYLSGLLKKN